MLLFASENRVDEAIEEFELMIEYGWRLPMGLNPVSIKAVTTSANYFWFEDYPILDSLREVPQFSELLDFVKTENAAM